jgi:hypothetical protein
MICKTSFASEDEENVGQRICQTKQIDDGMLEASGGPVAQIRIAKLLART